MEWSDKSLTRPVYHSADGLEPEDVMHCSLCPYCGQPMTHYDRLIAASMDIGFENVVFLVHESCIPDDED